MRYIIALCALLVLFACEREPDAATTYGIGPNYGGPAHAFANSNGATIYVVPDVLPEDAGGTALQDAVPYELPSDLSDDALSNQAECMALYGSDPEGAQYCACYVPKPENEELCGCEMLVCRVGGPNADYIQNEYATEQQAIDYCEGVGFKPCVPE